MKRSYVIRMVFALLLLSGILLFRFYLGKYLHLSSLKFYREYIALFIEQHYIKSVFIYILSYIGMVILMVPFTLLLNIAAGCFFGVIAGTIYSVVGATLGALCSLLIFRYLLGDWIEKKYRNKIRSFKESFKKNGFYYLLSLQLLPITPFPVINICAALAKVPLKTFIGTTVLGITPGILIYAWAGKELGAIQSVHDVVSWPMMLLFVILSVLALIPLVIKKISKQ